MRVRLLILIIVLVSPLGCQEISIGEQGIDLVTSAAWGRPEEVLKVEQYELWWYEFYDIDNIVFLREGKVIGQLKTSSQAKMWKVARAWAKHANRSEAYRLSLDKYIQDILQHHLRIGMRPEEVRLAWGHPKEVTKYLSKYGMREEWIYQRDPYRATRLVFTNEVLTDIGSD